MNKESPIDATLHNVTEVARDGAHQATAAVKEACQTLSVKAEETYLRSKNYVQQNPVPMVLGALVLGAAIGCLVALTNRPAPTLRQRFMEDPVLAARELLQATFQPIGRGIHHGYDSARDGAGHAFERFQEHFPGHHSNSLGHKILRHLKFW